MDCKNIFRNRRAINFFNRDKKLDKEILFEILNLATLSP